MKHDNFVRRVHVETLIERERDRVIIQCSIRRCVVRLDRCVRQSRYEFLDVSDALYTADGRAESRAIPEVEIKSV